MEALKLAEKQENYALFKKELNALLPVGSSEERVICVLDSIGWGYSYVGPHNMYSTSKKLKGGLLSRRHVNFNIVLDEEGKVSDIEMSINNTSRLG